MAVPSRDWSVFKQIFAEHWLPFQRAHLRYQTAYYDDLAAKMLDCGTPEKMGYLENFDIHEQAQTAVFEYVEVFYNRHCCHSANGYLAPLVYEKTLKIHEGFWL